MIPGLLAAIAVFSYLLGGLNGAIPSFTATCAITAAATPA